MASPPAASAAARPSFLDTVGLKIIESASSLDAHIDAGSLVETISAPGNKPTSKRSLKALAELRDLSRSAPVAVTATDGAVSAILRVVSQLTAGACGGDGGADDDDDAPEALQDAIQALSSLIGEAPKAKAPSTPSGSSRVGPTDPAVKEDEVAAQRARDVADLVVRHTENGRQLLKLLGARDTSTQHDAMVLLQRVYHRYPVPIDAAFLADPMALGHLMQTLQCCQADYVRNECLCLLLLITASNAEVQTIVTVQGLVETIFAILEEEDLSQGGKVARDLLRCLGNLVGNPTCQKYIRETGCIASLINAMTLAVLGRRQRDDGEQDDMDDDERADISEEARWACLSLLVDAALALAGRGGRADSSTTAGSAETQQTAEATANQDALVRAGAHGLCRQLLDVRVAVAAKLKLVELFEALETNALAAKALQSYSYDGGAPPLFTLSAVIMGPSAPLALRSALARIVGHALEGNAELQSFLCSSLSPQLDLSVAEEVLPAGRLIVQLLEDAAKGRSEPERLWFALHLVLAMLLGNAAVQSVCATMPVAVPSDAGPAETFLELFLRVFSACARACLRPGDVDEDKAAGASAQLPSAVDGTPPELETPAAALMAVLKVLMCWFAACPAALVPFASSPVTVPVAMDLTTYGTAYGVACSPFFNVQIEGLSCLLMGICVEVDHEDVDVASLMALLASRVGIEEFQQKVERLWRSEPLQKPPRRLADFRWHDASFRAFVRERQRAVQRRMVQMYVRGSVGATGAALSDDIADHYKQIIRVQDSDLREVRKENEGLRGEVEAFMRRALEASSAALHDRLTATESENEALRAEVEQLFEEVEGKDQRLLHERTSFRTSTAELEHQLQSVAISYEQVEQTTAALTRENAELRASLSTPQAAGGSHASAPCTDAERLRMKALEQEAAAAQHRVEELEAERVDLLDLLGRVVASCPEAGGLVAPLGGSPGPAKVSS